MMRFNVGFWLLRRRWKGLRVEDEVGTRMVSCVAVVGEKSCLSEWQYEVVCFSNGGVFRASSDGVVEDG